MLDTVRKLTPNGKHEGLTFDPARYGISLDHLDAVRRVIAREDRALAHPQHTRTCDRRDRLASVRDAVFDAASGTPFNPTSHDLRLEHARAVAEAMGVEAKAIRSALRYGRLRPVELFDHLSVVHEFVCSIIEQAMEGCL